MNQLKIIPFHRYLLFAGLILIFSACADTKKTPDMKPPVAEKIEKELTLHGDTRIDPYFWLNERDNPKVIEYLEAENAYTDVMMKHTENFQKEIFDEIIARIQQTDESVPYKDNGYYYYTRYEEGEEYPFYCRKKDNLDAEEEIMLNVNEMAEGYKYYAVSGRSVSPDNKILAYGVDTVSRRKYTIHFKNLESGDLYDETIPVTTGGVTWANDNKTMFYTVKDPVTLRSYKIMKHIFGTDTSEDIKIYAEADETFSIGIYKTKSKKYLVIRSGSTLSDEYRFLDANAPNGEFVIFQPRERGLEYSIDHYKNKFYIRTNLEATNFRLMETPIDKTTKDNWTEVIPHRENVYLQNIEIFENFMVVGERINGLSELRIIKWEDKTEHYIDHGEEVYTSRMSVNRDFDTDILRYSYTSLTTPSSTYDYDMISKEKTLLKQDKVLGGFNPENYFAERKFATADDGTQVPISLVYKKGLEKNGKNPLLLSGYGSYGSSRDPSFSSVRLSLLDRGFVYAIAHVRGGSEMGRQWYENGKLLKKKNTFTDFNDCAEFLIEEKYTDSEYLFAMGGSAGGLLMGAIINMQSELYKGVIATVPWVDVVTTMLDKSIPLTTSEFDEWGNPENKEYYDYMLSYSPYDNVEAKDYPALLVTTGLHDSQVQYFEPTKWVAKLRDKKTDDNLLILTINMSGGHGGASGRFERYKLVALEYVFMFDQLGIKE